MSAINRSAKNGILVVGAGLAGLTLALSLARRGIQCTVVERQASITPSKWAILLYPVGMQIFDDLGVLEEIRSLAMPLQSPQAENAEGEVLSTLETGLLFDQRLNFCLALGPSEIREVLRKHAISLGVEILEGYQYSEPVRDKDDGGIVGAKVSKDGQENQISSRLLVGADGYKSLVRAHFGIKVESRTYSCIVGMFLQYPHGLDRFRMIFADGYQVVILPCTSNRLSVGLTERDLSEEELMRRGGEGYVKRRISQAAPFLRPPLDRATTTFSDDSMLLITPEEMWASTYVVNGGVLVGDAAHSFHPGTGQGAQQAFIDALKLVPVIEECIKTNDFSKKRLREFERQRLRYMSFWKRNSRQLISMETAKSRFGRWLRKRYFRKAGQLSRRREFQEILVGLRPPTKSETLRILFAMLT